MSELDAILISAHRGNMRRYQRLLRTHLTELERAFVLRRLDEEKSALRDLLQKSTRRDLEPLAAAAVTCPGAKTYTSPNQNESRQKRSNRRDFQLQQSV
jgi:hypothetical protein